MIMQNNIHHRILLLSVLALLPLLGGTWILGLLFLIDSDSVALAWIFTMVNSLQVHKAFPCFMKFEYLIYMQGAAVFFFHVVRNKEVSALY